MRFRHALVGFAGVIALGAATAQALTFAKRDFVCPIDGKTFSANVVNSQSQFGIRLDLKPQGALAAPAPIPICPGSGFPVYRRDFSEAEVAKLREIVASEEYKAARAAHTDYYMVHWIELRLGVTDDWRLADLLLRASWEAEVGDKARLDRYRALARDRYDAVNTANDRNRVLTARLLAAELDRLLGRFEAAQARLDALRVATLPDKPPLRLVAAQIGKWVAARDAQPRNFDPRD